jgi:multiple sugar transport system substrate-binding protein
VKGVLDTPEAAAAVEFFRTLLAYAPKGGSDYDYGKVLEVFENGQVAMTVDYFAFFPGIQARMGEQAGFARIPEKDGRRVISLGGQGLSISTRIPAARQELAKRFIAWFSSTETQKKWVQKPGGFTANVEILKSDEFKKASPYNEAFATSMDIVQDFWNVPAYNELIAAATRELGEAIDGKKPSKEALSTLAREHEKILADATPGNLADELLCSGGDSSHPR